MESYGIESEPSNAQNSLQDSAQVRGALARRWRIDALCLSSAILLVGALMQVPSGWLTAAGKAWLQAQYHLLDWHVMLFGLVAVTLLLKLQQARAAAMLIPVALRPAFDPGQAAQALALAKVARRKERCLGWIFALTGVFMLGGVFLSRVFVALDMPQPFSWSATGLNVLAWIALKCWEETTTSWVMPEAVLQRSTHDGKRLLRLARWNVQKDQRKWTGLPVDGVFIEALENLVRLRAEGRDLEDYNSSKAAKDSKEDTRSGD